MHKFILFVALLSLNFQVFSQVNLDSLYTIWENNAMADTIRMEALNKFIWGPNLFMSNTDSALVLSNRMYEMAIKSKSKKYEAKALQIQGTCYTIMKEHMKGKDLIEQSLKIAEKINYHDGTALSLNNLGVNYRFRNDLTKAKDYYLKSLDYAEQYNNKEGILVAGSNLAGIYLMQNEPTKAEELYTRVLDMIEEVPKPYYYARQNQIQEGAVSHLGNVFIQQRKYAKGVQYFRTSLLSSEKKGDKHYMAHNLNNLGNLYTQVGDYSKAVDYLTRALTSMKDAGEGYKQETGGIVFSLGNVCGEQKNYSKALEYHLTALKIFEESSQFVGAIPYALGAIANDYKLLGEHEKAGEYAFSAMEAAQETEFKKHLSTIIGNNFRLQGLYQNAIQWCNKASTASDIRVQKNACECLYESYKALKNGNEALAYHEKYLILTDSLHEEEIGKNLQQMEFQNQMLADSLVQEEEKRKVELAHQEEVREKNRTKNIFMGTGFFFLLMGGGLFSRLRYIRRSKAVLQVEKDRSENLLLNILPAEVAEELKLNGKAAARDFDMVSIIFTDFKEFTETSEKLSAAELVNELNYCFEGFDKIMEQYGIEKIKTIGDAYMAAGGLPVSTDDSAKNTVLAALEMQEFIKRRKAEQDAKGKMAFEMRAGIHTGPVVAGIVGVKKFQYDIWGDTVNTASRMESNGAVGQVNISQYTYDQIKNDPAFTFENRKKIEVKGKGEMAMFFVGRS